MTADDSAAAWRALTGHRSTIEGLHLRDLLADENRFERFSCTGAGLFLDYSRSRATPETFDLLHALAAARGLEGRIAALFAGEPVNNTEVRPALHMALRAAPDAGFKAEGADVSAAVATELGKMCAFADRLHDGQLYGATGEPIRDVVNIGIGGSDLGAVMATEALARWRHPGVNVHFVSNIDGVQLADLIAKLDAATTLFIICSKSFTTLETLTNARLAREWIDGQLPGKDVAGKHFVAISTNAAAMDEFGIAANHRFAIWDWVGGRYSMWSAVGLVIAAAIGSEAFTQLLEGARAMDEHFRTAPARANLPVILGMLGVWYTSFLDYHAHAVLPYDQRLHRFPAFLQQLEMESNGKCVRRDGSAVTASTCPVIFGEPGSNGQHSFYQLLHQGTQRVSVDFIAPVKGSSPFPRQHTLALANMLAQAQALAAGRNADEVADDLARAGIDAARAAALAPHKVHPGSRPSSVILFPELTPAALGALVALYEHKVFVQSVLWDINPFDQWGVELGKVLAKSLEPAMSEPAAASNADPSTRKLLEYLVGEGQQGNGGA